MDDKIITLATLSFEKAQIVKTLLINEGVECFLEHINLLQGAVAAGVKVQINELDFEKAIKIFDAIRETDFELKHKQTSPPETIKILVPVDFSEYSQKAVDIAFDWVVQTKGEIILFNAYYSPVGTGVGFGDSFAYDINSEEVSYELKEEAEKKLSLLKEGLDERISQENIDDVTVATELRRGIAEHEIITYSELYKPSLIVMGTRGADKKVVDLIGSVTAEIIEGAKVPVLAVPESFNYKSIEQIKNIGYLSVFGESDYIAIEKLASIIRALDVKVKCVHITTDKESEQDKVKMDGLIEHFSNKRVDLPLDFKLVNNEDFWVGIEGFIQLDNIDVLSFTTFKRNLISRLLNPSVAKKMLFHSTTPLLVFHA
ncbi:universal stress protein [Labilibacter marinus]|uniref:universal stress protein n=1 Tax=Labilibacter marinus TaxID=1477105 RepID=UPI00082F0E77|nr:universal stress protein [Labilibacter marinus]